MPIATSRGLVAKASIVIDAPKADVWAALVSPDAIAQYMFGAEVVSTWKEGSSITWSGEWQGKAYQDRGVIRRVEPERTLSYTHFSPMSAEHHLVTFELSDASGGTRVVLTQDNNATEEAREHSRKNWETMLRGLQAYVEGRRSERGEGR